MSLYIASLNSGSNGNCYYIGNGQEAVLVDAGISCRETEKRMKRLGLSMQHVKAVFISHEHGDHIRGLLSITQKYQLPVYITNTTLLHSRLSLGDGIARPFGANRPVSVGALSVTAFPKQHDAADPHSFVITCNGISIGVFTDIGTPCTDVIHHFKQCHAVFLEANYDELMLEQGAYPPHLKKRISGDKGHLSNRQALSLFNEHRSTFLSYLFLSHLSKDNNNPEMAHALFNRHSTGTKIVIASRYEETAVYHIGSPDATALPMKPKMHSQQGSLF